MPSHSAPAKAVSFRQISGRRMDAAFHLVETQHRSVVDVLKRTYTREQALAKMAALPQDMLLALLAPLATGSSSGKPAAESIGRLGREHPHLALAMVAASLPDYQVQAAQNVAEAKARQSALQELADGFASDPAFHAVYDPAAASGARRAQP